MRVHQVPKRARTQREILRHDFLRDFVVQTFAEVGRAIAFLAEQRERALAALRRTEELVHVRRLPNATEVNVNDQVASDATRVYVAHIFARVYRTLFSAYLELHQTFTTYAYIHKGVYLDTIQHTSSCIRSSAFLRCCVNPGEPNCDEEPPPVPSSCNLHIYAHVCECDGTMKIP